MVLASTRRASGSSLRHGDLSDLVERSPGMTGQEAGETGSEASTDDNRRSVGNRDRVEFEQVPQIL